MPARWKARISESTDPASSSAERSQLKQAAQSRQACETSPARAGSASSARVRGSAAAKSSMPSTSQPVTPSSTESRMPVARNARHGTPAAAPSRTTRPQPSPSEVDVVSQAESMSASRSASGSRPWKRTTRPRPSSTAVRRSVVSSGPSPMISTRRSGTSGSAAHTACSSRSTRLCGTSRLVSTIVGRSARVAAGPVRRAGVIPLVTTSIGPSNLRRRRSSWRVDAETATVRLPAYTRRATRPSRSRPTAAPAEEKRVANWSWCTWWTTCTVGTVLRVKTGEKNGMPFWQSTTASNCGCRLPRSRLRAARA